MCLQCLFTVSCLPTRLKEYLNIFDNMHIDFIIERYKFLYLSMYTNI